MQKRSQEWFFLGWSVDKVLSKYLSSVSRNHWKIQAWWWYYYTNTGKAERQEDPQGLLINQPIVLDKIQDNDRLFLKIVVDDFWRMISMAVLWPPWVFIYLQIQEK